MTNLFLLFWIFFKSIIKPKRCNLFLFLRFFFTFLFIIVLSIFYIKSQDIHTSKINYKIDRIGDPKIIKQKTRSLQLNCYIDGSIGNTDMSFSQSANGLDIDLDEIKYDKQDTSKNISFDSVYNPIFNSPYFAPQGELLDIRQHLMDVGNSPSLVDSTNVLYLIDITRIYPKYLHLHRVDIHYASNEIADANRGRFVIYKGYTYGKAFWGDTVTANVVAGYTFLDGKGILNRLKQYGENTSSFLMPASHYGFFTAGRLFYFFSPTDISQLYVDFKFDFLINHQYTYSQTDISSISFQTSGNAVFSEMTPKPDEISMDKIVFNSPDKIHQILWYGLRFHIDLSDNKNIHTSRMFFVTTFISLLFAYWITLFVPCWKGFNFFRRKYIRYAKHIFNKKRNTPQKKS